MRNSLYLFFTVVFFVNQNFAQLNIIWEGIGSNGKRTTFTKINEKDWIESDGLSVYQYYQSEQNQDVKLGTNEYILKDKNRQGVTIYLNASECWYKDSNSEWVVIYYGKWKSTPSSVDNVVLQTTSNDSNLENTIQVQQQIKIVNENLVKIGNYYWQNENCRITKYMNGDPIFFAKNSIELDAANKRKEGAYCFVNFDNKLDSNYIIYNWYAIMDPRGFGTKELKIPNWYEWKNLISTLEKDNKSHNDLKKIDSWVLSKTFPVSNFYGFNGTPTYYGEWNAAYQQVYFKKTNGMFFWLPDPDVDVQFKIGEQKAFLVKFLNDGWNSKYSDDMKSSMFPMRLIKGQISYFDGQVISGKKEGNGKMYVRSDDYFHWDYVNDVNVQSGSVIQGFWINNKLEGKANITWSNGVSEEVLFKNNVHQGSFKIVDNKTQICLYDGKSFDSHFKKTDEEIQQEKLATKSIRINAYKTETFCSSNCERNAINALSQNSNSQGSSAKTQQNNSGPKWECSNCLTNSYAVSQPSVTLRGCNSSDGRHSWLKVDSNAPKWECNKCLTHSFRESQPSVTLRGCNSSDGRHLWLKVDSNAPKWECNKCLTHSYGASQPSNTLKGCTSSDGRHWWVKTN